MAKELHIAKTFIWVKNMIKNIVEYFEETLGKSSDKIAVADGNRRINFGELASMVFSVGTAITNISTNKKRQPIAVFIPKSIECIVSDIGITYSGNVFMNLDVKTPANRLKNIVDLVEPMYIVTTEKYKTIISGFVDDNKILLIDSLCQVDPDHDALMKALEELIDTDPFCLINTSGSTGIPKSVILNHRSFIDFFEWAKSTVHWLDDEIIGSLSPAVFDIYTFEICMMMAKSSTIVVINEMFAAFPVKILQLLNAEKVSFIFWVPTIMVNIANMGLLDKVPLTSLKMVWFAGEVFPTKQFNCWRRALPETIFVNMYGPIEITLDCTYYIVNRDIPDDEPIPIGYPCRNTDILILDDNDNLIGVDEEGELCVRGTSLAMGYYNNPEKTAVAFVQNPLNKSYPELIYRTGDMVKFNEYGEIVFIGRKDSLIKHSGYRIELSEIEHVIVNTLHLVKNGCAVYDYTHKEIVFYYEAQDDVEISVFRKEISNVFPRYMIPNRFEKVDLLPRNTNGKIDRLQLKNMANG